MPPLTWKVLGVAATTGLLILLGAWWMGPSLFGPASAESRRVVDATVTAPAECTNPNAVETVRFELNGRAREGTLSGCGHGQDEKVRIAVPADVGGTEGGGSGAAGPVDVRLAATAPGMSDLRRPVGLALLVLACAGGGTYAFLLVRGPRHHLALA